MDRKRLSAGIALLVVLIVLCIFTLNIVRNEWESRQGQVGRHGLLPGFGYCNTQRVRPCILSFKSNPNGSMVINVLVKPRFRNFYIKIRDEKNEYVYTCKKPERKSTEAFCTGKAIPVGKTLSFLFILKEGDTTLAEGSFPVIGMALATPYIAITPTPIPIDRPPR